MGSLVVVPVAGLFLLQATLAAVLLAPKRMAGVRSSAAWLYLGALMLLWLWQLGRSVDGFKDFALSSLLSVAAFTAIYVRYRDRS